MDPFLTLPRLPTSLAFHACEDDYFQPVKPWINECSCAQVKNQYIQSLVTRTTILLENYVLNNTDSEVRVVNSTVLRKIIPYNTEVLFVFRFLDLLNLSYQTTQWLKAL